MFLKLGEISELKQEILKYFNKRDINISVIISLLCAVPWGSQSDKHSNLQLAGQGLERTRIHSVVSGNRARPWWGPCFPSSRGPPQGLIWAGSPGSLTDLHSQPPLTNISCCPQSPALSERAQCSVTLTGVGWVYVSGLSSSTLAFLDFTFVSFSVFIFMCSW